MVHLRAWADARLRFERPAEALGSGAGEAIVEPASIEAGDRIAATRGLRIGILPAGSEDTASARIRAHILHRALVKLGVRTTLGRARRADVLYVQKRLSVRRIQSVKTARAEGRRILYDVDDLGEALWWWAPRPLFREMLTLTDLVITGTPEQAAMLREEHGAPRVSVLPCAIDYAADGLAAPVLRDVRQLRLLWFGNNSNVDLWKRYRDAIFGLDHLQPVLVIDALQARDLAVREPRLECHAWSRATFVNILRSCDLTCLMHDGSPYDRAKSNNRMTTSIAWGVPALVSATPDYERTAVAAGVPEAVFGDERMLLVAIDRLHSVEARRHYLAAAQPYVWREYSPERIAQRFLDLVTRESAVLPSC